MDVPVAKRYSADHPFLFDTRPQPQYDSLTEQDTCPGKAIRGWIPAFAGFTKPQQTPAN